MSKSALEKQLALQYDGSISSPHVQNLRMGQNRGKRFEGEIAKMLHAHPAIAFVHRPADVPPQQRARFMTHSPIDFYCYLHGGRGLVVECKAIKGKSLPFTRFSAEQWGALDICCRAGVSTWAMINWYGWPGREGQRGRAYAIPFAWLAGHRKYWLARGRKSWPRSDFGTPWEMEKVASAWAWVMTNSETAP